MRKWHALTLYLLCVPLISCGNSDDAETIYVLTPQLKVSQFTQDLAAIAKRHGLNAYPGQFTDYNGRTVYMIEASGGLLELRGRNVPMSGYEDPSLCGHYTEAHSDPGQYIVTIDHGLGRMGLNHVLSMIAKGKPRVLMLEISNDLKASGYDVRQSPATCSPLSKDQSDVKGPD